MNHGVFRRMIQLVLVQISPILGTRNSHILLPRRDIKDRWRGLTNGLAGLLCASLGSLDEKRTVSPNFALRPEGDLPPGKYHRDPWINPEPTRMF